MRVLVGEVAGVGWRWSRVLVIVSWGGWGLVFCSSVFI